MEDGISSVHSTLQNGPRLTLAAVPERWRIWLLAVVLLFTGSYFQQGGGFNQNSTLGEIREVVEHGSVSLDRWLPVTGDVSWYQGRAYSNKSPSMFFFAVPAYAVVYHGARAMGVDTDAASYQLFATHFLTIVCAGMWPALLGLLLLRLLPLLLPQLDANSNLLLAYLLVMSSMLIPYSGAAFVHNFETFTQVLAYYYLLCLGSAPRTGVLVRTGLASGAMMLANPLTAAVMPVVAWSVWASTKRFWMLVMWGAAAASVLLPLFVYNHLVFDFFLSTNRHYLDPAWTNPALFMGVFDKPDWSRLDGIFGLGLRTLLVPQPFLYLGFVGLFTLGQASRKKCFGLRSFPAAVFTVYLLVMLTFNGWHGGSCFGPRYFMPAMMFLALASTPVYFSAPRFYLLLVGWSVATMLLVSATSIWISETDYRPMTTIWRAFRDVGGDPLMIWPSFVGPAPLFNKYNLANLVGLRGYASLAPLVLIHALALPNICGQRGWHFYRSFFFSLGRALQGVFMAQGPVTKDTSEEASSQFRRYALTLVLCLVTLVWRSIDRLQHAHLWAEDGTVFLLGYLTDGFWAFLQPYRGYFHTSSHWLAWLANTLFGLEAYPSVVAWLCILVAAAIFAMLSLDRYRWIIPNDWVRTACSVLICLAPGSVEVFGNLANLHWILYFYAWLVAMADPSRPLRFAEMVLLTVFGFSTGEILVTLPLWALRFWRRWSVLNAPKHLTLTELRQRGWRRSVQGLGQEVYAMALIVMVTAINVSMRGQNPSGEPVTWDQLILAIQCTITQHLAFLPWLGPRRYLKIAREMDPNLLFTMGILAVVVGMILLMVKRRSLGAYIVFGVMCAFGVPLMAFIVRPESALWFGRVVIPDPTHYNLRYYFILAPFAVIFWAAILSTSIKARVRALLPILFVCAYARGAWVLFFIPRLGDHLNWQKDSAVLAASVASGCPKDVSVPIYPAGWAIDYTSKLGHEQCKKQ